MNNKHLPTHPQESLAWESLNYQGSLEKDWEDFDKHKNVTPKSCSETQKEILMKNYQQSEVSSQSALKKANKEFAHYAEQTQGKVSMNLVKKSVKTENNTLYEQEKSAVNS